MALVAIRERVDMGVVEQGSGAVSPRETLQKSKHVSEQRRWGHTAGSAASGSHLAANAQVRVGDELRLLVAVALLLQEGVQHAHGHPRQGHHKAQDLPCLRWRRRKNKAFVHNQSVLAGVSKRAKLWYFYWKADKKVLVRIVEAAGSSQTTSNTFTD